MTPERITAMNHGMSDQINHAQANTCEISVTWSDGTEKSFRVPKPICTRLRRDLDAGRTRRTVDRRGWAD